MHSVRTKFLILICGATIGVFIILGGLGTYYVYRVIEDTSAKTMQLLIEQKSGELDVHFKEIERAVSTLGDYILENADFKELEEDHKYNRHFMEDFSMRAVSVAKVTGNVVALYFRPDPDIYGGTAGIFMTDNGNGDFVRVTPTDLTKYAEDDTGHVGWYYEPAKNKEAMWMEPYLNQNINVYMISYVIPLYQGDKFLGVVGMDVNMAAIRSVVNSVNYNSGFGFLMSREGNLIYHRDYPSGLKSAFFDEELQNVGQIMGAQKEDDETIYHYTWKKKEHRLIAAKLANDMFFAISVPEKEIVNLRTEMGRQMAIFLGLVLVVTLLLSWRIMVRIVRPIQELTAASARIARGELNTAITYHSKDEIGRLADSIRMTEKELQEYIEFIRAQAYTDAMTGVRNKTAYLDLIKLMDKKIREDMADFAVVVFDVNGLKRMNDNLGHEYGDMLIVDAANLIKRVFGEENVYRIGGDEFIVVTESATEQNISDEFARFDEMLLVFNSENKRYDWPLSISRGAGYYIRGEDREYTAVFKRADEAMYHNKAEYYRGENDRRRS